MEEGIFTNVNNNTASPYCTPPVNFLLDKKPASSYALVIRCWIRGIKL